MNYRISEQQLNAVESACAQLGLLTSIASQVSDKNLVIEQHFFVETMHTLQTQLGTFLNQVHAQGDQE